MRVAVAAKSLDAGVSSLISCFGGHVFRNRTFGVQASFAGVNAFGSLFYIGASSLKLCHVRHDQLVCVSLLLRQRRSGLNTFGGVRNRTIERCPARSKAKRRHHQACVTEHSLRLIQPLACDATDQAVRVDVDVIESQRRGVAEADAVLVLWFVVRETLRTVFDDEPTWTAGRVGQYCVSAGDSAIADPLFVAVDLVADDAPVLQDRVRRGAKRS